VRGSYNYHAQTFYDELPVLFERYTDVPKVVWKLEQEGTDVLAEPGSALMLISFAVIHYSFQVSIYFSASSLLII
jgi:hypothetical protein